MGESREKLLVLDGQNRTPLCAALNLCVKRPQDKAALSAGLSKEELDRLVLECR